MKNDSFLFPFDMIGDKFFDSNNDGKLSGFETAFRDAANIEFINKLNNKNDK